MMDKTPDPVKQFLHDKVLQAIREKAKGLHHGRIVITVQDGHVTYVDTDHRVAIRQ